MTDPREEKLMTIKDIQEYLQVCRRTAYIYAETGKIPAFKIGASWRCRKSDIDAMAPVGVNCGNQSQGVANAGEVEAGIS